MCLEIPKKWQNLGTNFDFRNTKILWKDAGKEMSSAVLEILCAHKKVDFSKGTFKKRFFVFQAVSINSGIYV